uniref:Semaphorin 4e n=1 Tax=Hippocampus comes TaxID=109280 RepID=A0A3Q2YH09_HIPCM
EGVSNYTIMLLQEDTKLLLLGAREALFALDLEDISKKQASQEYDCKNKGKDLSECKNYIKILHKTEDNRMYVCGTNAFDPECDYMVRLIHTGEDGKGKCPFDPYQRHASIMVDDNLYSATSMNFLGSELVLMRSSPPIRTEIKTSWLNEPNFISLAQLPKSDWGDDDKVYLFFSETAVEYDCYKKPVVVSRVARVCKGDTGGRRTLQRKWTSFLKARLECPVLGSQLPNIIQNTLLTFCVFFCSSDTSDLSAVCAYSVFDINRVFAEGQFKTLVPVETSFIWVAYSGEVPDPRPGSVSAPKSLDQFFDIIQPIGEKPLLERRGAAFTCIVVHQVEAADGQKFHVMFIGTGVCLQLRVVFRRHGNIRPGHLLFITYDALSALMDQHLQGQLYAGSDYGVVQVPLATCGRSLSCLDCILARDPYCGWDATVFGQEIPTVAGTRMLGVAVKLACPSSSNLATTKWEVNGRLVASSPRHEILQDELLILNVSDSDAGRYRCLSMERSKGDQYTATVAEYQLSLKGEPRLPQAQRNGSSTVGLQVVIGLLVVSLVALLAWNFYNGHLPLPWNCNKKQSGKSYESNGQEDPGPL